MTTHTPDHFLATDPGLSRLTAQALRLLACQRTLRSLLPPALAAQCHVGLWQDGRLVLHVPSGTHAAQLKQRLTTLTTQLQQRGVEVTAISIRVQPGDFSGEKPRKAASRLSPGGSRALQELAGTLPDSPLKQALERLASRSGNSRTDQTG